MAQQTMRLYISKVALADKDHPSTVQSITNVSSVHLNALEQYLYVKFDALPSNLRHRRLYYTTALFRMSRGNNVFMQPCSADFDPATLTWNNKPAAASGVEYLAADGTTLGDRAFWPINTTTITTADAITLRTLLNGSGYIYTNITPAGVDVYTKKLTDGTTKPYLYIRYDDTTEVVSQVQAVSGLTGSDIDPRSTYRFTWKYVPANGYHCADENWTQASAKLYFKRSTDSSWQTISVSGSTMSVTSAANTFPANNTFQWYIQSTDTLGNTSTTPTYTFSTQTTQITPDTYPTGNSVDNRTAKSFSWHFASSAGNYAQKSAKLYWRVQNASSWNQISASGTTQSLSVPAYTFPANSTIEWYLGGVDVSGGTSVSSTLTFKTQAYTLALTTYPSGSNNDTRISYSLAWTLSSSAGAVTQTSAIFYWRVSTATTYNRITNSSATKNMTIPANTFPTGATIQWYLSVTAKDGTTLNSQTATFSTVAPQITATTYPSGSSVGTQNAITFKWKFTSAVGDYAQTSAKLYWRVGTTGNYTQVSISGSTQQVTVAAYTFPVGSTIQWYLSGTDIGGHTSTTSATTFTTVTPQITATSVPSGSNVDTRSAITIKWKFASDAGDYPQQSATFYWRVSGASSYTAVAASGTTAQVTIPAYTFPTASTIQWYLSGTDKSGHTSSTTATTFSTASPAIKATNYPTGSNVDTRSDITFAWEFQSAAGVYPQTSATFYWRVGTSGSYTQVAASGSTTSVTIPANTFPTASTIQWYVRGTDRSGRTTQTSATTFSTVSPSVKATAYPSGTDVYTAAGITFKWKIESAVGDYSQRSATFYWRKSTADPYTSIAVSGNTKQLTVAANTFPTNATIYWYLSATDVGGHTSSTSVQSFKTVTTQITVQDSPISGYTDPRYAITFKWYFASTGGAVPQQSATFYWKTSTESSYQSVAASGGTTKVTIAANTFPVASTIEWYVSGTDVGGTSSTSPVYSFSTAAGTAYAYPQSPIGTAEDGSKPITFRWSLVNSDGSSPSKVTVSWKRPTDVNWTILTQSTTPIISYAAPAGTFQTGEIEWKVVATNRDNVDGPAGTAAFVCLRAPDPPRGLRATTVPISTISWQATGQEAFEIYVDGELADQAFGQGVNSWTVPQPLEDGVHTVTIRIQGAYGLWSDPAAVTVNIANAVPEGWESFSITGEFAVDAVLTADGAPAGYDAVHWYRDGERIARTTGLRFSDRVVLGTHRYYAEIWASDGNYVRSNELEGSLKSCITRIAPLTGGEWLDLRLSENSDSIQSFRYERTSSLRHILGANYPVLELADFTDGSGSYDCAFKDVESAAALEKLRGQVVILKSRGGNVVIGALTELYKQCGDFYITFSFSVQQIAWEDFVDE